MVQTGGTSDFINCTIIEDILPTSGLINLYNCSFQKSGGVDLDNTGGGSIALYGNASDANVISINNYYSAYYDNSTSGLLSDTVNDAINEVANAIGSISIPQQITGSMKFNNPDSPQLISCTLAETYYKIDGLSAGNLLNTSVSNNQIVIGSYSGYAQIICNIELTGSASETFTFSMFRNDSADTNIQAYLVSDSSSTRQNVVLSGIAISNLTDTIDIRVKSVNASKQINIENISISISGIGV